MGADGCWCAPRSSKPLRGVQSFSGGFDSHMFPPKAEFLSKRARLCSCIKVTKKGGQSQSLGGRDLHEQQRLRFSKHPFCRVAQCLALGYTKDEIQEGSSLLGSPRTEQQSESLCMLA